MVRTKPLDAHTWLAHVILFDGTAINLYGSRIFELAISFMENRGQFFLLVR